MFPVDKLPLDDLDRASAMLQKAQQKKLLPDSEIQLRLQEIEKQKTAFQIERDGWWIGKLQQRGDR